MSHALVVGMYDWSGGTAVSGALWIGTEVAGKAQRWRSRVESWGCGQTMSTL